MHVCDVRSASHIRLTDVFENTVKKCNNSHQVGWFRSFEEVSAMMFGGLTETRPGHTKSKEILHQVKETSFIIKR